MHSGLVGAVVGLALCGLGVVDGWWVLWLGLAGVGIEGMARLRLEPAGNGDGVESTNWYYGSGGE